MALRDLLGLGDRRRLSVTRPNVARATKGMVDIEVRGPTGKNRWRWYGMLPGNTTVRFQSARNFASPEHATNDALELFGTMAVVRVVRRPD